MLHLIVLAGAGYYLPLPYVEPVFRPPAEADSLIVQTTVGCSWNKCSFCDMYTQPQQQYKQRPLDEIDADLHLAASLADACGEPVRVVFLADGDAMGQSTRRLRIILESIKRTLPHVSRVSSYCLPRNIRTKSVQDLSSLRELGLRTMYVGCESGDNTVLSCVGKGETMASSVEALDKLHDAGLKSSVMILHGLGGRALSEQHVAHSAELIRRAPPNYLSTLVVSFPMGMERHAAGFADVEGGLCRRHGRAARRAARADRAARRPHPARREPRRDLPQRPRVELPAAKGTLPRDHAKLLRRLGEAQRGSVPLRPEARGL